jgi:hypothetical protein
MNVSDPLSALDIATAKQWNWRCFKTDTEVYPERNVTLYYKIIHVH